MKADAIFIGIEVTDDVAADAALAAKLEETCPVDIYADAGGRVEIVEGREDTAAEKIARLADAGITVAEEISQIPQIMKAKLGQRSAA